METVLLAVGDGPTRDVAREALANRAYRVTSTVDAHATMVHHDALRPVVVVIAEELGDREGHDLCRRLRAVSDVPILMLLDSPEERQELLAFAFGADDCIVGRLHPRRFAVRIDALARRHSRRLGTDQEVLSFGNLRLSRTARVVTVGEEEIQLTRTEFDLLEMLMENPEHVLGRAELVERLWPGWQGDGHILEVQISRLRGKIRQAGGPRVGQSVRGVGYRLGRLLASA